MCAVKNVEQLVERARAGDAAALGCLLDGYRHYLSTLARVQLGRRLQARTAPSDLVQQTLLHAQRNFAAFRGSGGGQLAAWLRAILAQQLAGLLRHHLAARRRPLLETSLAAELDESSSALAGVALMDESSPSEHAMRQERAVHLADALARLKPEYREVLVLRHLEGHGFQEIASRLGRSVDSVKHLWTRGMVALRKELSTDE